MTDKKTSKRADSKQEEVERTKAEQTDVAEQDITPEPQQGTVANQDVHGTAPASHAGDNVDTNAGK